MPEKMIKIQQEQWFISHRSNTRITYSTHLNLSFLTSRGSKAMVLISFSHPSSREIIAAPFRLFMFDVTVLLLYDI